MGALRALTELTATFQGADALVLCYHRVRDRERFTAQMHALADLGNPVLSIEEFIALLAGRRPLPAPAVLLTFDGCYSDQLEHAVPVLNSFNFPATFFPLSASLTVPVAVMRTARRNELRELVKSGHTIGCHTHTHPDLTRLAMANLQREVVGSKQLLEDAVGQRVRAFCYPYGACNPQVASLVRDAGFDVAFTVELGGVRFGTDPYRLKRLPVFGEPRPGEFSAYLSGTFLVSGPTLLLWKVRERLLDRQAPAIQ